MVVEITKEEIIELNREIVEEFGGSIGLQNESNLDFVLAKVRNARDIFRKAAELINEAEEYMVKMTQPEKLSINDVEIRIKEYGEKDGKEEV